MKKEYRKVARLQLARETLVRLDDRQLESVIGACMLFTFPHCCPDAPTLACD